MTVTSNATNFSEFISSGIDPRTGSYSINIDLGDFISHKTSGSVLSFQLSYSASNSRDSGFGRGWALPTTRFDNINNVLSLSTGQSFELIWNNDKDEYDIPYRKLKDIRVLYLSSSNELKVLYKDGRVDFIDYNSGLILRTISPSGLPIYFEYYNLDFEQTLWRVYDNAGREFTIDWWTDEWNTTVKHSFNNEVIQLFTFNKVGGGGFKRLTNIYFPEINSPMSLTYRFIEHCNYDVIEKVVHHSGMVESISYLDEGLLLPDKAPFDSAPCVSDYTLIPGSKQKSKYTVYEFSDKNYLGFASDREYAPGEDTLFKAEKDYRYTSTEINGSKRTVREYNKYHLIEKESFYQDSELYRTEDYVYFAELSSGIEYQPAIYSLLKSQVTTYYNSNGSRVIQQSFEYDDYGNQTQVIMPDGSRITRIYYSAQGESTNCPADPNLMVRYLKEETHYPITNDNNEIERTTTTTYKAIPSQGIDTDYFVVQHTVEQSPTTIEFSYYEDEGSKPLKYGRLKSKTRVQNNHSSNVNYEYNFLSDTLQTVSTYTSHDSLVSEESENIDYFWGALVQTIDQDGVSTDFVYDKLGRNTKAVVLQGTEYEVTREIIFSVGDGNNSKLEVGDDGQTLTTIFNNAGNVIEVKQNSGLNNVPKTVLEKEYNEFGLVTKQTETDWFGSDSTSISITFDYDFYGNIKSITHQDGRVEKVEQNYADLSLIYEQVGLLTEITDYNLSGSPIRRETRDNSGNLLAKTDYVYDGYSKLIETRDTSDRRTVFEYDEYDRLIKSTRYINNEEVTESYTYPDFAGEELPSSIKVNNVSLGEINYDGFLRIKSETSVGVSKLYYYTGAQTYVSEIETPYGDRMNISNDAYIQRPESVQVPGEDELTSIYQYDNKSGLLSYSLNQSCERSVVRDSSGRVLSEDIQLNDGVTKKIEYQYSELGKTTEIVDVFGGKRKFYYDEYARLKSTIESFFDSELVTTIEYDSFSRPFAYTTTKGNDVAKIDLTLNALGMETKRIATFNGIEEFTIHQEFNSDLMLSSRSYVSITGTTIENFSYDDLNRLTSYTSTGPSEPEDIYGNKIVEQRFSYDIYGNVTEIVNVFSSMDSNITTYNYDTNYPTRLNSISNTHQLYPSAVNFEYDQAGNLLNDNEGRHLIYDSLGRLTAVSNSNDVELTRYQYDSEGRLVAQTVEESLIYLFYINDKVTNEMCGDARSSVQYAVSGLVSRSVEVQGDETHEFLLGNGQGSVMESLSENEGSSDRIKAYFQYTPYGEG
ncbi:RHS repeat protein [Vibrio campbellii]|uniref:RHS repeat protein n=1 Tax=Vibrio campbellii TaxID=680 RepID=UPI000CD340FA|nr:RHS repeat protein [Vibrio campbellii]AUV86655.1 RHS repeat protein [Vibrio campbellii]